MSATSQHLNRIVAALLAVVMFSLPSAASDGARLDGLFEALKTAETPAQARRVARDIEHALAQSGSPAMDLLLKRGNSALEAGDSEEAIGHFTALTDHAPDFAEGWHMRAVALAGEGLYGPALADVERALSITPRHFNAIYSLGAVLNEVNRPSMAYEAFSRVLAIHPHHEAARAAMDRLGPEVGGRDL